MRLVLAALALLTALVYWPGMHGPFVYDDWHHVANNDLVIGDHPISLTAVRRPLEIGSFRANYRIWGKDTFSFHLVNLGVHLLNGLLLFQLAQELGLDLEWSALAAGVFWLHPLQSEAVLYISGRSELMATMGMLGSVLGLIRKRYGIAVLYALFALLSKEIALITPILWMLVIEYFQWSLPRWVKWLPVLGFVGLCAFDHQQITDALVTNGGGASVAYAALSLLSRVVWPVGLTIDHDFYHLSVLLTLPALVVMAVWPVLAWRFREDTIGFGLLWTWCLLVPHLFVEPAGYLAEHHLYGPFVGISVLLACMARDLSMISISLGENPWIFQKQ